MIRCFTSLVLLLLASSLVRADLSFPDFFCNHMVLQQNRDVAIWGNADPNAAITLSFKGNQSRAEADADGKWRATIQSGPADAKGATLTVESGDQKATFDDVLVGEVWLASGQSNMVFTMNRVPDYAEVIQKADFPLIRFFNAPTVTAVEPQDNIAGEWTLCSPKTAGGYSAVAFFFARKLHQELGIPVGVIKTAWGGKPVETFTSRVALKSLPGTRTLVEKAIQADKSFDAEKSRVAFESRLDQWKAAFAEWKKKPAAERQRAPRKPASPKRPLDTEGNPGVLFNSMINPFVGYTIQGAIWYQGEANAKPGKVPYDKTLPLLIRDWRERWGDDFSFYFVQLANFRKPSEAPGTPDDWALLQDRMRLILQTTPKTGMAVINDVGEANDIHPKNKKDPGERLARWALAKDYAQNVVHSGPLYSKHDIDGDQVRIQFDSVGDGLKSRDDGKLERFEIAGKDRKWHWGDAKIQGKDTVVVSSPDVPQPLAVRYAWASNPEGANLVNSEGLPTSVFRTDDWDDAAATESASKAQTVKAALRGKRQQLAAKVKLIIQKRDRFDRNSDEYKELNQQRLGLMKQLREAAPAR